MTLQIDLADHALLQTSAALAVQRVDPWDKGRPSKRIQVTSPKGKRTWTASSLADNDIPWTAMEAYKRAAVILAEVDPGCQIPWTLLAAIGRVESNHGQYAGATLGTDGVSRPLIIGVALNGVGPVAIFPDTDNGDFDQDKRWDRAVGPMQFIPTTWAVAGVDGDGDGVRSPNDIDDAALASAVYLCAGEDGSLLEPASMRAAIYHYNYSSSYVSLVMAVERSYRSGDFEVSTAPPTAVLATLGAGAGTLAQVETRVAAASKEKLRHPKATSPDGNAPQTSKPKRAPAPASKPGRMPGDTPTRSPKPTVPPKADPTTTPPPGPTPTPDPTPDPVLVSVSGVWNSCAAKFCLTDASAVATALDLGLPDLLTVPAADDFDGDLVVETNGLELTGLVGTTVTLMVEETAAGRVVYVINGKDYRLADRTFAQPLSTVPPV